MKTFTAAPWHVHAKRRNQIMAGPVLVATCADTTPEDRANAMLIAEAPALLEVLEDLAKIAEEANALQHSGATIPPEIWSDMYYAANKARAISQLARRNS